MPNFVLLKAKFCWVLTDRDSITFIDLQLASEFASSSFWNDRFISLQLALYVLSFLEARDLLVAAQTCRYWRILAEDDLMWKEKCQEEGISERRFTKVSRSSLKNKKNNNLGIGSSWKVAFLRQVRIEANWRTGNKKPSKVSFKFLSAAS